MYADWVKLNLDEAQVLWPKLQQIPGREEFTLRNWYERRFWDCGPLEVAVIATDGPNGVTILNSYDEFREPGVRANVVDTVGAGDAFTAALLCLYLEGKPMKECARFAVHYAARVCEHPGGTPRIDRAEVERAAGFAP